MLMLMLAIAMLAAMLLCWRAVHEIRDKRKDDDE